MARRQKPWKQPKAVSQGVSSVLDKLALGKKLAETRVLAAWADAVGDSIARRSFASVLDEQGTLYVTVESPTWKNELVFIQKDIVRLVNERFAAAMPAGPGNSPVKALEVRVGEVPARPKPAPPAPPPPPATADELRAVEERLGEIHDPELKEAARRMLLQSVRTALR